MNHTQVTSENNYILNYIIPNFEKNPTENAKYMVKLILEKGMNPNKLKEKYLKKSAIQGSKLKFANLPERILDVSPISLACMKYQNNALNFIIKYNSTIREILAISQKVAQVQEKESRAKK